LAGRLSGRDGEGASGKVESGRSLAVFAVLLSTIALKLPASDGRSSRADFDRAFGNDTFEAISDVTLTTAGLSRRVPVFLEQRPGHSIGK
jgi:hypothetical protein